MRAPSSRFWLPVLVATVAIVGTAVPTMSRADVLGIAAQTTYKEYWVPHSQFTGGCLGDEKAAGSFYIEPGRLPDYPSGYSCVKTVDLSIPDDVSNAAKAELYLDLWRAGRGTTDLARFQINGGTVRRTYRGADWSRTPFIGTIPLSELRQGTNSLTFSSSSGAYHIHDIMVRVTYDPTHPLSGPGDVTPPTGALTAVSAAGQTYDPAAGGTLNVDDDTVTLTANASGASRVEFHAYYDGYDEDVDGSFVGWHNRYRNRKNPGALGVIDHIATDTIAPYTATWTLPQVPNQTGVRFKIRVVDAAGNVTDAAGGASAPFTLTRSHDTAVFTIPGFKDGILWHDGLFPADKSYTLPLPSDFDPSHVDRAYLLGSFWNNPYIAINGNPRFAAFDTASGEDTWASSERSLTPTWLKPGNNTITYSHRGGFGEFIEKPGPMLVLHYKDGAGGGSGGATAPTISQPPADQTVTAGETATFTVAANGTAPLTYQWQRDGTNIVGANSASYTTPVTTLADSGVAYRVRVSNSAGAVTSATATLTVEASPSPPGTPPAGGPWFDTRWELRVPIDASAAGAARSDHPAGVVIDFPTLLREAGMSGTVSVDRLRLRRGRQRRQRRRPRRPVPVRSGRLGSDPGDADLAADGQHARRPDPALRPVCDDGQRRAHQHDQLTGDVGRQRDRCRAGRLPHHHPDRHLVLPEGRRWVLLARRHRRQRLDLLLSRGGFTRRRRVPRHPATSATSSATPATPAPAVPRRASKAAARCASASSPNAATASGPAAGISTPATRR